MLRNVLCFGKVSKKAQQRTAVQGIIRAQPFHRCMRGAFRPRLPREHRACQRSHPIPCFHSRTGRPETFPSLIGKQVVSCVDKRGRSFHAFSCRSERAHRPACRLYSTGRVLLISPPAVAVLLFLENIRAILCRESCVHFFFARLAELSWGEQHLTEIAFRQTLTSLVRQRIF